MLARIANDIYEDTDSAQRDRKVSHQRLDGTFVASNSTGFQGAVYQNEDETIVAYRGTATLGGVLADVRLAVRDLPNQVDHAYALYVRGLRLHQGRSGKLIVCGHSLGGYLTQAICGMTGAWGITFNGAGARSLFTGRVLGLGAKVNDLDLARADERVLNITIKGDPVSARIAGKMIGKKIRLDFGNIANAHFMATVLEAVLYSGYGHNTLERALERATK
jgi:hypothetical protein